MTRREIAWWALALLLVLAVVVFAAVGAMGTLMFLLDGEWPWHR